MVFAAAHDRELPEQLCTREICLEQGCAEVYDLEPPQAGREFSTAL